jgi:hypothetical protein
MFRCGYRVLNITALLFAILTLLDGVERPPQVDGGVVEGTVEGTLKVYRASRSCCSSIAFATAYAKSEIPLHPGAARYYQEWAT